MTNINNKQAFELIEATRAQGTIFTVTFVKRTTGETRTMNARLGVKRGVTGVGMARKSQRDEGARIRRCISIQKILPHDKP